MDDFEKTEENGSNEALFAQSVKAGKRTYFFDVKATRSGEHFITITESKKSFDQAGIPHYEKHRIFLYQEDFEKFIDCFDEAVQYVNERNTQNGNADGDSFSDISFEDL